MNTVLRISMLLLSLISLFGCQATMIPVHNLYNQHVPGNLSQDSIQNAIKSGANSAGWQVSDVTDNQMLATYNIRSHTVIVSIGYAADGYSILYKNSNHMKVKCGTRPNMSANPNVTSGLDACPGGTTPTYIHVNYKEWIEQLNAKISAALKSACYTDNQCRG